MDRQKISRKLPPHILLILDLLFGFILPGVLVLILLGKLIFGSGYIFYGDEQTTIFFYPKDAYGPLIYSWFNGSPTSSLTVVYSLLSIFSIKLFGTYYSNHLIVFLIPYLSGPLFYFPFIWIMKHFEVKNTYIIRIAAVIGTIFYVVNWQNPNMVTPLYTWGLSYMIAPLLIYLLLKIFNSHKKTDMLAFAVISIFGDSVPMWIVTVALFIIVEIFLSLFKSGFVKRITQMVKDITFLVSFSVLANAYFLFQSLGGFFLGVGGQYATFASVSSSVGVAHTSSFYSLFDVFLYGQPTFNFFGINPKNFTLLNVSLPLIVIVLACWYCIRRIRINKHFQDTTNMNYSAEWLPNGNPTMMDNDMGAVSTQFKHFIWLMGILLFISLFLSKGYNPPFGDLYNIVIDLSPPGILGITRDVTPFLMISALSYAFIFAFATLFSLGVIYSHLREFKITKKVRFTLNRIVAICLLVLILIGMTATFDETHITMNLTDERFSPIYLPSNISRSVSFINSLHTHGNVMWIPTGGTYPWKNNSVLTNFGANLVQNSSSPEYIYNYLFEEKGNQLGTLLNLTDTTYLVYNANATFAFNYNVEQNKSQILSLLANQTDMNRIYHYGGIYIYKNLADPSLLYAGVPLYGNPEPSIFNSTTFLSSGILYVNSTNPYIDLYESKLIKPSVVIRNESTLKNTKGNLTLISHNSLNRTNLNFNTSYFKITSIESCRSKLNITVSYNIPYFIRNYMNGVFDASFSVEGIEYSSINSALNGNGYSYLADGPTSQTLRNNNSGNFTMCFPIEKGNSSFFFYYHEGYFQLISPFYYGGTINSNNSVFEQQFKLMHNITPGYGEYSNLTNLTTHEWEMVRAPLLKQTQGGFEYSYCAFVVHRSVMAFNPFQVYKLLRHFEIVIIPTIFNMANISDRMNLIPQKTYCFQRDENLTVNLSTPLSGFYNMSFAISRGQLSFNGKIYSIGTYSTDLYLNNESSFSLNISQNTKLDLEISNTITKMPEMTKIMEKSPVEYSAHIYGNGSVLIILPTTYSSAWVLNFDGKVYPSISLYGGSANGFVLNNPNGTFTITYKMQTPLMLGYVTTVLFITASVSFVVYNRVRKNGKRI
jgi:hypothetical protein